MIFFFGYTIFVIHELITFENLMLFELNIQNSILTFVKIQRHFGKQNISLSMVKIFYTIGICLKSIVTRFEYFMTHVLVCIFNSIFLFDLFSFISASKIPFIYCYGGWFCSSICYNLHMLTPINLLKFKKGWKKYVYIIKYFI